MNPRVQVDLSQMRKALREYIPTTRKDSAQIVNQRSYNVSLRALGHTPKADRTQVEQELGVVAHKLIRSRKTGQLRKGGAILDSGQTLALRLAAAQLRQQGEEITQAGLRRAAQRLLGRRLSSIGFNAAGWLPAIRRFASGFTGRKPRPLKAVRQFGADKGGASLAQPGAVAEAKGFNAVESIQKVDRGALQRAINDEAQEILRHVQEKLAKGVAKFNRS